MMLSPLEAVGFFEVVKQVFDIPEFASNWERLRKKPCRGKKNMELFIADVRDLVWDRLTAEQRDGISRYYWRAGDGTPQSEFVKTVRKNSDPYVRLAEYQAREKIIEEVWEKHKKIMDKVLEKYGYDDLKEVWRAIEKFMALKK